MRQSFRPYVLALDVTLLVVYLLLFAPRLTTLPVHEWLGIALVVPVLLHVLLSWRWILDRTGRMIDRGSMRARANFLINLALFVLTTMVITSGIVISEVALPTLGIATMNDRSWRALHNLSLNWLMLALGLHVAMNWRWITSLIKSVRRRVVLPRSAADTAGNWQSDRLRSIASKAVAVFGRTLAIAGVAAIVAGLAWLDIGPPSRARVYRQNEIARFAFGPGRGVGQLAGETFLLCLVTYSGRRWLKLRL